MALPELPSAADEEACADVSIETAPLASRLEGGVDLEPLMQVSGDQFQLDAPAGRYRLVGGRRILVDPRPGASARDVRLYLLGTVMGALCHQRSVLPLHAAAIESGGGAVAFAGPSGAGKSTLAAQFLKRGRSVMADDLCAVDTDPVGRPRAHPGLARIKLWGDSLPISDLARDALPRIADDVEKFSLSIPARARALTLRRLYILRPGATGAVSFRRLGGPEAVQAAVANVYRWPLAVAMGVAAGQFQRCVALATQCEMFELNFTHHENNPYQLPEALDGHMDA